MKEHIIGDGSSYEAAHEPGCVVLKLTDATCMQAFTRLTPEEAQQLARRLVSHAQAAAKAAEHGGESYRAPVVPFTR